MKRGRSTNAPTKAQQRRFELIKERGCVACWLHCQVHRYPEIHHLTIGGKHGQKRRGHDFTIGLCAWHHRGINAFGNADLGRQTYGPSLHHHAREFRAAFGSDDSLLEFQNAILDLRKAA
ncbi:Ref family recombination enhancement nuclease [Lysobacter antibioticus]|uniref:Ref family recombination enhancement nuclease n=1 Tax=Lysobacter antibioticus TaxID=84531 RepID=UPI0007E8EA83|nr:Ref family recombination enhancement nuclease [Lysobacter antibioticus]